MSHKIPAAILLTLVLGIALGGVARADDYPPTTTTRAVTCAVDPDSIHAGDKPMFLGTGWLAGSTVRIVLVGVRTIGHATVHGNNSFATHLEVVRSVAPRHYRVEFVGRDVAGHSVRCFAPITVLARDDNARVSAAGASNGRGVAQHGTLPFTGGSFSVLVWASITCATVGAYLVARSRRRAWTASDPTRG